MQAIESDPDFVKNVQQIILLGGAFSVNGNVNPAAEANVNRRTILMCFSNKTSFFPQLSYVHFCYA